MRSKTGQHSKSPLPRIIWIIKDLYLAFRPHWKSAATLVVLGFVASVFEGLGISAVIPLVSFVTGGGASADSMSRIIGDLFGVLGIPFTFRYLFLFIGGLLGLRILLLFVIQNVTARVVFGYERNMRMQMFEKTLESDWPFLSSQKIGHLNQFLITNTTNVSQFFGMFSTITLIATKIVAYSIIAVNISPYIALISLGIGVGLLYVLQPLFRMNKQLSARTELLNRSLAHFVNQHTLGMKSLKSLAVEIPVAHAGNLFFSNIRDAYVRMVLLRGILEVTVQYAGLSFIAVIFFFMYNSPHFNVAAFAVVVFAVNQIFTQIQAFQTQLHAVSMMLPYLSAAQAYMQAAESSREKTRGVSHKIKHEIRFDDVSFAYLDRRQTLEHLTFTISRGSICALIGPSGAGKSTVTDLLLGLIKPSSGRIYVDGIDMQELSRDTWRSSLAYVTQDAFLLNDTIEQNIRFYDSNISLAMVEDSARSVGLHTFVESLPKGYQTLVGDQGVFLSGGQRQRIILARMLARKPALLILDEATSALDTESKKAITQVILNLRGSVTVFVVTHNDDIVLQADKVIVLEQGRIEKMGNPEEVGVKTNMLVSGV